VRAIHRNQDIQSLERFRKLGNRYSVNVHWARDVAGMFPQCLGIARDPNDGMSAVQQLDAEVGSAEACGADYTDYKWLRCCHDA
jgi:hypothetical protein